MPLGAFDDDVIPRHHDVEVVDVVDQPFQVRRESFAELGHVLLAATDAVIGSALPSVGTEHTADSVLEPACGGGSTKKR